MPCPVTLEDMERSRTTVDQTHGEQMVHRLSELDDRGDVLGRLGESAELGAAHDSPATVVDRGWCGVPEKLIDPVGGQHRDVVCAQLDYPLVLASKVMHLLQIGRREDTESPCPEVPSDLQRACPRRKRLV